MRHFCPCCKSIVRGCRYYGDDDDRMSRLWIMSELDANFFFLSLPMSGQICLRRASFCGLNKQTCLDVAEL
ncbi:hypothetical protein T09_15074 [Trichinella sp. T9]|nr:hypothetical protein T09_15074 [Trichinella sp. T9]